MTPVEFKGQMSVLKKPEGMSEEDCGSLPMAITKKGEHPSIESVWELTDEDLVLISKSRRIRHGVIGTMHPPIYMSIEPCEENSVIFQEVKKIEVVPPTANLKS